MQILMQHFSCQNKCYTSVWLQNRKVNMQNNKILSFDVSVQRGRQRRRKHRRRMSTLIWKVPFGQSVNVNAHADAWQWVRGQFFTCQLWRQSLRRRSHSVWIRLNVIQTNSGGLRPRQRKRTAFKTETLIAPSFVSTPDSFLWRQLPTITTRSFLLFPGGFVIQ